MLSCAVIGCGAAGIAASAALRRSGLLVTCFELAADSGGIWGSDTRSPFSSRGLLSPVYPTMRCVIPKDLMSFSDRRFDYTVPQFPHCSSVRGYLEQYAERMGVRGLVRFNTKVQFVRYDEHSALWCIITVNVVNGDVFEWFFDRVCVCTGNTQEPRYPKNMRKVLEPYVREGGEVHHASHVKAFRQFKDKRVVVVGDGVTAWDYYWELKRCGADVYHSSCSSLHQQQQQKQKHDEYRKEWEFTTMSSSSRNGDGNNAAMRSAVSAAFKLLSRPSGWRDDVAKGNDIVSSCLKFKSGAMLGGVKSVGHPIACDGRGILFAEPRRRAVDILDEAQQRLMAREGNRGHSNIDEVFLDSIDAVIFATGYNQRYPFLDDEMRNVLENRQLLLGQQQEEKEAHQQCSLDISKTTTTTTTRLMSSHYNNHGGLYLGTLYIHNPSIAFVGMQKELLPPFLLFEAQAKFISYAFTGRLTLPNDLNGLLLRQSELIRRHPPLVNLHNSQGVGLYSAVYFNVLQEELCVGSRSTYTACIMERQKWFFATSLLRLVHKLRSMAPLKRKKQHILFSNAV